VTHDGTTTSALERELTRVRDALHAGGFPAEAIERIDRHIDELAAGDALAAAVGVGDRAPMFTLPDATGHPVSLRDALDAGPAVLTFYRGEWCPYCNLALRHLQQELEAASAPPPKLIAISPQLPDRSLSTVERLQLSFDVLSDHGSAVARSYGVAFEVPDYLLEVYAQLGFPLDEVNGAGNTSLPVPATYVVDQHGVVRYAFIDPDHTRRADPHEVLACVRSLA
jgi:peroxiredoxin